MRKKKATGGAGRAALPALGDINAKVRSVEALRLLIEGHTYQQIAEICGYANRGGAYKACQRELDQYKSPVVEEARAVELARLDALLRVFMPKALAGDGWSADRVVRFGERRARLLGMDFNLAPHPGDQQSQQMIILGIPAEVVDAI